MKSACVSILVASMVFAHAARGTPAPAGQGPAAHATRGEISLVEKAIEMRLATGHFMGSVLIARDGQILLNKGYGSANMEWRVPNSPRSRFRIGSVTKQFTAAAVLLLQERQQLSVGDPISKYLPDAPAAWRQITVLNLLTHTSGIPDLTAFPDFDATEPFPATPEQLVKRFRDKPLDFQPGTDFRYSNSGYILLGDLIEKITHQTYRQFVQENLFAPLGMRDSGYDSNSQIIERHAEGYAPGKAGLSVAGYVDMTIPFAAGGLYSTTEDLLRWEEALYSGRVLSPQSLATMTTAFKKDYALGLVVDEDGKGNKVIWHRGAIEGFSAYLIYVPVEKLAVIVLSNVEGAGGREVGDDILRITHHEFLMPK